MKNTSEIDIVGVGLGPANLALVTAMLDMRDEHRLPLPKAVFLERSRSFAWHPGMMLPGSRLQVPFLKDLATQRNPRSRYTFLNYIFEQGRLEEFINLRMLSPEREEFSAYMSWICGQAGDLARFGAEVVALRPLRNGAGQVERIEVEWISASDGTRQCHAARAVVLAAGRRPAFPAGVRHNSAQRITHTANFLPWTESLRAHRHEPLRLLVVGSGQSAAEAACHLLREYPGASVELCHRRFVLHAIDDNPFLNEAYFGDAVDDFHALGEDARRQALGDLAMSNFGVVDRPVLEDLYRYRYQGLSTSRSRLSLLRGHDLLEAQESAGRVHCVLRDVFTGSVIERVVDGLVLATGYRELGPGLLEPLAPWLKTEAAGVFSLGRDYRLAGSAGLRAAIFMHGSRESVHGPGEYNLSSLAQRAQVLLDALLRHLEQFHGKEAALRVSVSQAAMESLS